MKQNDTPEFLQEVSKIIWREWEGPLFVVSVASRNTISLSRMPQVKPKEGFHGL